MKYTKLLTTNERDTFLQIAMKNFIFELREQTNKVLTTNIDVFILLWLICREIYLQLFFVYVYKYHTQKTHTRVNQWHEKSVREQWSWYCGRYSASFRLPNVDTQLNDLSNQKLVVSTFSIDHHIFSCHQVRTNYQINNSVYDYCILYSTNKSNRVTENYNKSSSEIEFLQTKRVNSHIIWTW